MMRVFSEIYVYWVKGGMLLIPIAAVSFAIWASWLRLQFAIKWELANARRAELDLDAWRTGGMHKHMDVGSASSWSVFLQDLLEKGQRGAAARKAFEQWVSIRTSLYARDLLVLKALTSAAPLLGLLGTVSGMVETFTAVSAAGGDSAAHVAGGISSALITTQFGLAASLPGVFGLLHLHRLRVRLQSVSNAMAMMLHTASRAPAPVGGVVAYA